MPRTLYTKIVHQEQRIQLARQEKALFTLARELHHKIAEPVVAPATDNGKRHRRVRIEQQQRHKPIRPVATPRSHQADASPTEDANSQPTVPETPDGEERELLGAVGRLVELLRDAVPLVELLDSAGTSPIYRQALRGLVGRDQYTALSFGLLHMTSPELWDTAHAKEFVSPDLAQRLTALGVSVSEHAVRP